MIELTWSGKEHCAQCHRLFDDDNPPASFGGIMDDEGNYHSWAMGRCCTRQPTEEEIIAQLAKMFRPRTEKHS